MLVSRFAKRHSRVVDHGSNHLRAPFFLLAALLALSSVQLQAQQRPNLSGEWTLVSDPGDFLAGPLGHIGTITQDRETVTFASGPNVVTYRLDGLESVKPVTTVRGETWVLTSQAQWVQHALLVTTTTTSPIGTWKDMLTCSLDRSGNLNVVVLATPKSRQAAMVTKLLTYRKR
jgi:hypothetical protein